jgi:hypothetical protein
MFLVTVFVACKSPEKRAEEAAVAKVAAHKATLDPVLARVAGAPRGAKDALSPRDVAPHFGPPSDPAANAAVVWQVQLERPEEEIPTTCPLETDGGCLVTLQAISARGKLPVLRRFDATKLDACIAFAERLAYVVVVSGTSEARATTIDKAYESGSFNASARLYDVKTGAPIGLVMLVSGGSPAGEATRRQQHGSTCESAEKSLRSVVASTFPAATFPP